MQLKNKMPAVLLFCLAAISTLAVQAQEKGADIEVNINKSNSGVWYTSPWVWIVGGAIFILLLVALLRGSNSRN